MSNQPLQLDPSSNCRLILRSLADTHLLAGALAEYLKPGHCVALSGEMGAGKTTLVRAIVTALNGPENHVASPSYSLQNEYRIPGGIRIEHWDLYRVREAPLELLEEEPTNTVRLIEWPERIASFFTDDSFFDLKINLSANDSGARLVVIVGEIANALAKKLKALCE